MEKCMDASWPTNHNMVICVLRTRHKITNYLHEIWNLCLEILSQNYKSSQAQHFPQMRLKRMHNPKTTQSGNEFSYKTNSHFCNSPHGIMTKIIHPLHLLIAWHSLPIGYRNECLQAKQKLKNWLKTIPHLSPTHWENPLNIFVSRKVFLFTCVDLSSWVQWHKWHFNSMSYAKNDEEESKLFPTIFCFFCFVIVW